MDTILFKGFKQVVEQSGLTFENGYIYFVRTNDAKTEGYIYFNGKKYCVGLKPEDIYDYGKEYYGTYQIKTFTEKEDFYTLYPNIYYTWSNFAPVSIVFDESQTSNITHEYIFRIDVGENLSNYTLQINDVLSWANDDVPDFEPGYSYEISIIDHYATYNKFKIIGSNV